jgi:AcrR family transcriptional regulator
MAKLFRRLYHHAKRRIKEGLRDQRTFYLYEAACRLLVTQDHEQVSVARLASEAGISVGAFYQRFASKDAFLGCVVSNRMASAEDRMGRELDPERWRRTSVDTATQASWRK